MSLSFNLWVHSKTIYFIASLSNFTQTFVITALTWCSTQHCTGITALTRCSFSACSFALFAFICFRSDSSSLIRCCSASWRFTYYNQQESPAIADKPARRESLPKLLQFDMPTTLSLTIVAYLHAFNCCCVRNPRNSEKFTENSNL